MKIIQVSGRSNSGKTTFIRKLIPELKKENKASKSLKQLLGILLGLGLMLALSLFFHGH